MTEKFCHSAAHAGWISSIRMSFLGVRGCRGRNPNMGCLDCKTCPNFGSVQSLSRRHVSETVVLRHDQLWLLVNLWPRKASVMRCARSLRSFEWAIEFSIWIPLLDVFDVWSGRGRVAGFGQYCFVSTTDTGKSERWKKQPQMLAVHHFQWPIVSVTCDEDENTMLEALKNLKAATEVNIAGIVSCERGAISGCWYLWRTLDFLMTRTISIEYNWICVRVQRSTL